MGESILPEELLFKIFTRLPYPEINRIRCLSRKWNFLCVDGSSDGGVRAFHDEVNGLSRAWPSFSPLQVRDGRLLGYYARADEWIDVPMRFKGQGELLTLPRVANNVLIRLSGPLICWPNAIDYDSVGSFEVVVANIFTGNFKHLAAPVFPRVAFHFGVYGWDFADLVFHADRDGFTVVLIHSVRRRERNFFHVMLRVYNSKTSDWCREYLRNQEWLETFPYKLIVRACPILVDDSKVVMLVKNPSLNLLLVIGTYSLKTKQWDYVDVTEPEYLSLEEFRIGVCGSRIIVVGLSPRTGNASSTDRITYIFEFSDQQGLELLDRGHEILSASRALCSYEVSFDEKRVYLCRSFMGLKGFESEIHAYHLQERIWTQLPAASPGEPVQREQVELIPLPGSFSPGLNPFQDPSATKG